MDHSRPKRVLTRFRAPAPDDRSVRNGGYYGGRISCGDPHSNRSSPSQADQTAERRRNLYRLNLFVPNDGKICRQSFFDNRSGRMTDNGMVDCLRAYYQSASKPPMQWSSARAQVISEGFRRR
jgi:hypothetical protein